MRVTSHVHVCHLPLGGHLSVSRVAVPNQNLVFLCNRLGAVIGLQSSRAVGLSSRPASLITVYRVLDTPCRLFLRHAAA